MLMCLHYSIGIEAAQTIQEKLMESRVKLNQPSSRSTAAGQSQPTRPTTTAQASGKEEIAVLEASLKRIRDNVRNFYIEIIRQIKARLIFTDPVFEIVNLVEPANARSLSPNSLAQLFNRFPSLQKSIDIHKADKEWREHSRLAPSVFGCETDKEVKDLSVEQYWRTIFDCKIAHTTSPTYRFPLLTKCICFLFCLSTSNAAVERLFSALKLIKNDQRNKLHDFTIVSLLRIKYWLKNQNASARDVVIPDDLVDAVAVVKQNATIKEYLEGIYDEDCDAEEDENEEE